MLHRYGSTKHQVFGMCRLFTQYLPPLSLLCFNKITVNTIAIAPLPLIVFPVPC